MHLDVKRESRWGWSALGAVAAIGGIALLIITDWGESGRLLDTARSAKKDGPVAMREQVASQEKANRELTDTIRKLKEQASFQLQDKYLVKGNPQPGYFFVTVRGPVIEKLKKRAEARGIDYDEWIGFGAGKNQPPDKAVPDDKDADFLLKMLQLTEKAVNIGLSTPSPLERLLVTHADKEEETGPDQRPPLLREYALTLDVRGSLKDILWILHRLSLYERGGAKDFPLILRGLTISGENATPKDDIQQLDAVFEIAGMQFIPDEERQGREPASGPRRGPAVAAKTGQVRGRP